MSIIRKTQIVELIAQGVAGTGNTQTNFQFTPQTYLQDKNIMSIETYSVDDIPKSPLGNTIVSTAQMQQCFITLYFEDPFKAGQAGQFIQYFPLVSLHRVHTGTNPFVWDLTELQGQIITWEKSFVTLTTAFANTTNLSFLFNVGYKFKDEN